MKNHYFWLIISLLLSFCVCKATAGTLPNVTLADPAGSAEPTTTYAYSLTTLSITSSTAQLTWTGSGANRFDIRWRKQGDTQWITSSEITANSYLLTDLVAGETYEWQLLPEGSGTWLGDPVVFATVTTCPPPTYLSLNSLAATSATLYWTTGNSEAGILPTRFLVDYRITGSTAWTSVSANPPGQYGNSYALSQLLPNTAYEWRVRGDCSTYSAPYSFTTPSCSPTDIQVAPLPTEATVSWRVSNPASFTLRWRPQGGAWETLSDNEPTNSPQITLRNLTPNTVYEWQLSRQGCGTTPVETAPQLFTTTCAAATDLLLQTGVEAALLYWRSTYKPNRHNYALSNVVEIRPKTTPESSWTVAPALYLNGAPPSLGYDYYQAVGNLASGTAYEVRVQTTCPTNLSALSAPVSFTTASTCTNSATNLRTGFSKLRNSSWYAVLSWDGVAHDYYAVRYRSAPTASWLFLSPVPPVVRGNMNYAIFYGIEANSTYEWQVVTYCTTSLSVTPALTATFATPCAKPTVLTYNLGSSADYNSALVSWFRDYSDFPALYSLRYRPVGSTTYTSLTTTSPYNSLTGLTPNTVYEWDVANVCVGNSLTYTAPQTFTTTCRQLATQLSVTNKQYTSASLTWSTYQPVGFDASVTYVARYRPVGGDWTTKTVAISPYTYLASVSITDLTPNTVYEWDVTRQCTASISSSITAGTSFTTSCRNPVSLTTTDVTAVKATVRYTFQHASDSYQVRYRRVGDATWTALPPTTSPFYTLDGLTPYTNYEWQVAPRCPDGAYTDFSASQAFTTDCYVPADAQADASNSYLSVIFTWKPNANVPTYRLQYRLQGTTDWTTQLVTSWYNQVYNLIGRYEWRVQADCVNGLTSDFTPIQSFTAFCDAPRDLSISQQSSFNATATWRASGVAQYAPSAVRYQVQWRATGSSIWNSEADIAPNRYLLTGLAQNTSYEVRVLTQCGNAQSAPTNAVTFGATCSAPTGLSSTALAYFNTPGRQFYWNAIPGVTYLLRWRLAAGGSWQTMPNAASAALITELTPGLYEWQVQSACVDGTRSAFVGGATFEIPACLVPATTSYLTDVQATSAILIFTANADRREFRWRAVGSPGWNVLSQYDQAGVAITDLTENVAYEWQARPLCANDPNTPFGPLQTFTTTCGQPANLRAFCLQPTSAVLVWNGGSNSTYQLDWRVAGTTAWQTRSVRGTIDTLRNLTTGTAYEWQVRPACSPLSATTTPSERAAFKTQCPVPTFLEARPNGPNGVMISWGNSGCSPSYNVQVRINNGGWTTYTTTGPLFLNGLPSLASVEYQVRSNCTDGSSSDYSSIRFVSAPEQIAINLCAVPTKLTQSPLNDRAFLFWEANGGGAVELRIKPVGGSWQSINVPGGTTYTVTGLQPNTTYIWQVRSACSALTSDFSAASVFLTTCPVPDSQIGSTVAGADNIRLFFFNQPSEARYRPEGGNWTTVPTTTSPLFLTGLAGNTRYEIQFRASCGGTSTSEWSAPRYVTTACPAPIRVFSDQIGETSVRVNWSYNPYFTSPTVYPYGRTLRYRPLGSSTWTNANLSGLGAYPPYSLTLTGLSPQTTYEWQVMYDCGSGGTSATPTQAITFRTTGTGGACAQMATIQTGLWTDAATWSCGRVPLLTDAVLIRHVVTMPGSGNATVQRVTFEGSGQVRYSGSAAIRLGQ